MKKRLTDAARQLCGPGKKTASLVWLLCVTIATTALQAQTERMSGYSAAAVSGQLAFEASLRQSVDTARARALSRIFSSEPHVAGTPRQRETAFLVDSLMQSFGLSTVVDSYLVYLPLPTRLKVSRVSPDPLELSVAEPPLPEDVTTQGDVFPQFNAYTGRGDVTAEVVFANYGLIEDYEVLAAAGVSVEDKIVVARYGRSYRGIKAREAERHGAVGLLLYSDPADDGYTRGDVYPEGPYRSEDGVQRGSIKNGNGDPSTPGGPSVFSAPRVPESEMEGIAHIPVGPISYASAAELLRDLRGVGLPQQDWQGGLPFRYHLGPGPVTARIVVQTEVGEAAYHAIYNTLAFLPGSTLPDQWVIIGGHRDAWGPGAIDNVSGTVSVLEAARVFARMADGGSRPKRSIVFATWDAEEWGLIGSTEYVENHAAELRAKAMAYLNQDSPASGPNFGAGASAPLKRVIREVARTMENPFGEGSVYDSWQAAQGLRPEEPTRLGDLGGGSDFAGFYNHLGVASASYGFGGTEGGVYHSAYDTYRWMSEFGDPNFLAHAAAAGFSASLAARLANSSVFPLDQVEFADQLADITRGLEIDSSADLTGLEAAIGAMRVVADHVMKRIPVVMLESPDFDWTRVNRLMVSVERQFQRDTGLRGREWFRNLLFAADRDNGYSNMPFPAINEALRDGETEEVQREIEDLTSRVESATDVLRRINSWLSVR